MPLLRVSISPLRSLLAFLLSPHAERFCWDREGWRGQAFWIPAVGLVGRVTLAHLRWKEWDELLLLLLTLRRFDRRISSPLRLLVGHDTYPHIIPDMYA